MTRIKWKYPETNFNFCCFRELFSISNEKWTRVRKLFFLFWKICVCFVWTISSLERFSFIATGQRFSGPTIIIISLTSRHSLSRIDNIFMLPLEFRWRKGGRAGQQRHEKMEIWGRKSIFVYLISEIRPAWKLLHRSFAIVILYFFENFPDKFPEIKENVKKEVKGKNWLYFSRNSTNT